MNPPANPDAGQLGDGRVAVAVDRPESPEALQEVVARRVAEGHAIYPQGGRTALDYGGTPREPGVAIDTTALDRVIDYPAADMTITAQAGITLSALRAVLAEHHQRLTIDAPLPDRATLGGVFACNASGPRRFGAGRPRDMIIGVSFVTSDGEQVKGGGRVVKNVAGYDLPKLLTGSVGTLGVLTQMTLKVRPAPEAAAVAWVDVRDALALTDALNRLNTSATRPMSLDLLNRPAAKAVCKTLGLPELPGEWALAVGFEDNAPSVAWQVDRLLQELGRSRDEPIREGVDALATWAALADYPALEVGPITVAASVRLSAVAEFVSAFDPGRWAVLTHAGNGLIRAHAREGQAVEMLAPDVDRLRALAVRYGGNLTIWRCPAESKGRLKVWGEPRADWAINDRVKRALDPRGVMNPGRFVGTI